MDTIGRMFTYVNPTVDQLPKYREIRDAALVFARVIEASAQNCGDRDTAIRYLREAVMFANAAIALEGLV